MKRLLLLFSAILFIATTAVHAQNVSADDALNLAKKLWPAGRDGKTPNPELAYTAKGEKEDHPYYYIFNRGNNEGFLIISADSRSKKILAYSTRGSFDINTAPPEMKAWLGGYEEAIGDLMDTPDSLLARHLKRQLKSKSRFKSRDKLLPSVAPLLKNIRYSQEWPYNAMCPSNGVTGCVATGAVQIMRYHCYPKTPTGKSHSYVLNGQRIGTTYNTSYDWNNMINTYSSRGGTNAQNKAIAKLMFDAGVSCNMEYTPNMSGANTMLMAEALATYFGYDIDMTVYRRDAFSDAEFVHLLKRELSAGRPVLFSGSGSGGGHCFVCDGYDKNGLFHFNWGWNGMSDGYYDITNLSPKDQSTGGVSGSYNKDVAFIGGIRPNNGSKQKNYLHTLSSKISAPLSCSTGQSVTFSPGTIQSCTLGNFNGKFGVALYKDGEYVSTISSMDIQTQSGYYYTDITFRGTFPKVASGNYQVMFVSKEKSETEWHPMPSRNCSVIDYVVSGNSVKGSFNYKDHPVNLIYDGTARCTYGGGGTGGSTTTDDDDDSSTSSGQTDDDDDDDDDSSTCGNDDDDDDDEDYDEDDEDEDDEDYDEDDDDEDDDDEDDEDYDDDDDDDSYLQTLDLGDDDEGDLNLDDYDDDDDEWGDDEDDDDDDDDDDDEEDDDDEFIDAKTYYGL